MSPKLHIIANCTDRKRVPVAEERRLRSVPNHNLRKRASIWWERLTDPTVQTCTAAELYAGSHWSAVSELPRAAREAGFTPKLWITSAGYGFLSGDARVNSYSATFSGSHPDSVIRGSSPESNREGTLQLWWELLSELGAFSDHPRSIAALADAGRRDYFLIITSPDYLTAIDRDLREAISRHSAPDRIVIVSSRHKPPAPHFERNLVPADARLLCSKECPSPCPDHMLRGPRGALSAGIALEVLRRAGRVGFAASTLKGHLEDSIMRSPALTTYDRRRADDVEIVDFIKSELGRTPPPSCSALLRKYRDGGRACEQSRFSKLYWQTKGGADAT